MISPRGVVLHRSQMEKRRHRTDQSKWTRHLPWKKTKLSPTVQYLLENMAAREMAIYIAKQILSNQERQEFHILTSDIYASVSDDCKGYINSYKLDKEMDRYRRHGQWRIRRERGGFTFVYQGSGNIAQWFTTSNLGEIVCREIEVYIDRFLISEDLGEREIPRQEMGEALTPEIRGLAYWNSYLLGSVLYKYQRIGGWNIWEDEKKIIFSPISEVRL